MTDRGLHASLERLELLLAHALLDLLVPRVDATTVSGGLQNAKGASAGAGSEVVVGRQIGAPVPCIRRPWLWQSWPAAWLSSAS